MNLYRFSKEMADFIRAKRLVFINEGRHRAVFKTPSGKFVVKIPIAEGGWWANHQEARDFQNKDRWLGDDRLARCRLIDVAGTECLVMELVTMPVDRESLPNWTDAVDCQQVGYTRRGKLVAYDWSN